MPPIHRNSGPPVLQKAISCKLAHFAFDIFLLPPLCPGKQPYPIPFLHKTPRQHGVVMIQDKYIGLILAMSSSVFIGLSFIITKKGLMLAQRHHGVSAVDGKHHYLKNWTWWAGMGTMAAGEILNFSAYSFAPAILVTPLGALSVILGAIFASIFLKETLGTIGRIGCMLSVVGAVIVVLHAPEDKNVTSIDELLFYALQPGFIIYCALVVIVSLIMIYKAVPKYGKTNPFVYVSICSLVGSVSVMSIKAFGIALKLTFTGNNQFTHLSTYVFGIVVAVCIVTQMNYFNKALEQFSTNVVNPIYFVSFTTATITASTILYQGFNVDGPVYVVSLIAGFIVIFSGVYLLDSIARGAGATNSSRGHGGDSEDERLLMSEATLLENEEALGLTGSDDESEYDGEYEKPRRSV